VVQLLLVWGHFRARVLSADSTRRDRVAVGVAAMVDDSPGLSRVAAHAAPLCGSIATACLSVMGACGLVTGPGGD